MCKHLSTMLSRLLAHPICILIKHRICHTLIPIQSVSRKRLVITASSKHWQNSHVPPAESIWKQFKRWKLQNIVPWAYTTNGSHAETLTDGFWTSFPQSLKEIMALCDTASKCIGQRKVATEHMFYRQILNPKNQPTAWPRNSTCQLHF